MPAVVKAFPASPPNVARTPTQELEHWQELARRLADKLETLDAETAALETQRREAAVLAELGESDAAQTLATVNQQLAVLVAKRQDTEAALASIEPRIAAADVAVKREQALAAVADVDRLAAELEPIDEELDALFAKAGELLGRKLAVESDLHSALHRSGAFRGMGLVWELYPDNARLPRAVKAASPGLARELGLNLFLEGVSLRASSWHRFRSLIERVRRAAA